MSRIPTALFVALCAATAAFGSDADEALLPRPAALEPNVRFWTRIYTEVDGHGGLIHDSEHLDVVYEVLRFPEGLSRRTREARVERAKRRTRAILRRLAQGERQGLSPEEAAVLARWPQGTSDAELSQAARRVRFQLGQADKFRAGLVRAGRWADHIEIVLRDHGVPGALAALPHVESSYDPRAFSRVGAAGIWQFTRSTGRRYMRVDHVVDERMDPYRASVAAARLLRDNYRRLESWPLAITAYNHGVAGMARAVRTTGTRDMGVIARRYQGRTFGFASRNFYAEFLAAWDIHREPERWFGAIHPEPPLEDVVLETDAYYSVASLEKALGIDRETLRQHNLALRPSVWNGAKLVPRGYPLRIPSELLEQPLETVLAAIPPGERLTSQKRDRFHKVRRGETLSVIARRYGVRESELVALNNLRSRHRIRSGQVLRLPDDGSAPIVVARSEPPSDGIYQVRRGDNLSIIAARFGVEQHDLVQWNRLRDRNRLSIGQRLRVAPPGTVVASAAEAAASDAKLVRVKGEPAAEPVAPTATPEVAPELPVVAEPAPQVADAASSPLDPTAPEWSGAEPDALVVAVARPARAPEPDPSSYAVGAGGRITVQAEETLGHYAEWLEVSAGRLRQLNRMNYATPLVIGRQKKLDFSRVTPEVFEQRRLEYHRTLQEEFFDAYLVTGTTSYVLRRGDSPWYVANRKFQVPIWLLRQYNPDVDFGALPAGTTLIVPVVEPRDEAAVPGPGSDPGDEPSA